MSRTQALSAIAKYLDQIEADLTEFTDELVNGRTDRPDRAFLDRSLGRVRGATRCVGPCANPVAVELEGMFSEIHDAPGDSQVAILDEAVDMIHQLSLRLRAASQSKTPGMDQVSGYPRPGGGVR